MFFTSEIRCCGRLFNSDGWGFDSANISDLRDRKHPTTGAYLQQFFCVIKWVGTDFTDFAHIIEPLKEF